MPWLEDPGTLEWHIRGAQTAKDPWGDATPSDTANDPNYPAGSWNPGDRNRALVQNAEDEPVFATDNVYIEDKHIDALPPYFAREALAIPRTRTGLHSPNYSVNDPFAALWRNYIPFPTVRRNQILPVPYGQWPSESDTSDSSNESDQERRRQRGTDAAGPMLAESVPCLDHSSATDPFNVEGPDFEWNTLAQIDRDILGPE